jgi:hypothetical protein
MNRMINHLAMDIEIPATPRAPTMAKMIASMKKTIARPIRLYGMIIPP